MRLSYRGFDITITVDKRKNGRTSYSIYREENKKLEGTGQFSNQEPMSNVVEEIHEQIDLLLNNNIWGKLSGRV